MAIPTKFKLYLVDTTGAIRFTATSAARLVFCTVDICDSSSEFQRHLEVVGSANGTAFDMYLIHAASDGAAREAALSQVSALAALAPVPILGIAPENTQSALLQAGVDVCVHPAADAKLLASQIKALFRRAATPAIIPGDGGLIALADLQIDQSSRTVFFNELQIKLTKSEFQILVLLAKSQGRVFSRQAIGEQIWGDPGYRELRAVDVHVSHLRSKLKSAGSATDLIETVRGIGYRFSSN